jgi:hypothetical protein
MDYFDDKFMTQSRFSDEVEQLVKSSNGLTNYIDAIIAICDNYEIEIDTVSKLISKPLKDKLKYDAQKLNFIKRTTMGVLPIV